MIDYMKDIDFSDIKIKAKMLVVEKKIPISEFTYSEINSKELEDSIKKDLTLQIVNQLMKDDLILFTKQEDFENSEIIFRARGYIANKEDVSTIAILTNSIKK